METSTRKAWNDVPISAFSERVQKSIVATPPASMVTRMVGYPEWHGDAMYDGFRVQASGAFTPLNQMQYTKVRRTTRPHARDLLGAARVPRACSLAACSLPSPPTRRPTRG